MPRAQINTIANILEFNGRIENDKKYLKVGKNIIAVKKDIIKILAYSAIKIMANDPLLYSVLNPDTSSDSPSAKSKGLRLVSARVVINHIKNVMGSIINGIWEKVRNL